MARTRARWELSRLIATAGPVSWSASTGAHWVTAAVDTAYRAAGGTTSSYGYPVSDAYPIPGGQRVDFQTGHLIR